MFDCRARAGYYTVCAVLLVSLFGSAFAASDDAVLERYRTSQGYGSVAFSHASQGVPEEIARHVEEYARSRGIHVVQAGEEHADTLIGLTPSEDGEYLSATRHGELGQIDKLEKVPATTDGAELIVDELLLLWHPPNSNSKRRSGSMDYILAPTSYQPRAAGIFNSNPFRGDPVVVYCSNQRLFKFDSITPSFSWESFPRSFDIASDSEREDYRDVAYQFELSGWRHGGKIVVTDLSHPTYTVEEPLNFCEIYSWRVRAVFTLDGVPRQTEWAGFYYKFSKPWFERRGRNWDWGFRPLACPYIFITPKNPFDDSCDPTQSFKDSRK